MSKTTLSLLLVALCVLFMSGCAANATSRCNAEERRVTIQVVRHRWHTGIIIPRDALAESLSFLERDLPVARWYEIGWGDNRFYREPDSNWLMMRALFWPTDSVLHVVGLERNASQLPHGDLLSLSLSAQRLVQLQNALAGDFERDGEGEPVIIEPGLYGTSWFYRAEGPFWFGQTCNAWTVDRLAGAGVPLRTFMAWTAEGAMEQLREAKSEAPCLAPRSGAVAE